MTDTFSHYDEISDTLSITFAPGEHATGIELTDHILLRINLPEQRAVGMTLLDYSLLTQPTELGPRHFPLTGLAHVPPDIRDVVVDILLQSPVREILALSAYMPSDGAPTPIIAVQPLLLITSTA